MKYLLSLDLSTTCCGWSVFEIETRKLVTYGILKPSTKGLYKMEYPKQQLTKMIDLSFKLLSLIENYKPHRIVVEEITGSRQRLGQKVLDGIHWLFLYHAQKFIDIISYYDVSGIDGWRTNLGLRLTEADKLNNKESKKINKLLARGSRPLHIVDAKDLACRYVNSIYGLNLNAEVNQYDSDVADSVSMGDAFLRFRYPKL